MFALTDIQVNELNIVDESALKEELRFGESKITKLLNENIGSNSIKQIVFY